MEAVKRGGDRQELHEVIREHSLAAWARLREGRAEPTRRCARQRPAHHSLRAGRAGKVLPGRRRLRRRCARARPQRLRATLRDQL